MGNILSHREGNGWIESLPIPRYPIDPVKKIMDLVRNISSQNAQNVLSYGGITMESHNHGKPNSPNIVLDSHEISATIPQAWMKNNNYYYNYDWAVEEARFLGMRIPNEEEWLQFMYGIPGEALEKNAIINGWTPPAGLYVPKWAEVWCAWTYSYWWCCPSSINPIIIPIVFLENSHKTADIINMGHNHAFSLRLMKI